MARGIALDDLPGHLHGIPRSVESRGVRAAAALNIAPGQINVHQFLIPARYVAPPAAGPALYAEPAVLLARRHSCRPVRRTGISASKPAASRTAGPASV